MQSPVPMAPEKPEAPPAGEEQAAAPAKAAPAGPQPFVLRWLTTLTVSGCVLGVVVGLICNATEAPKGVVDVIRLPGSLFLRALKATVVPMIFASMATNAAALGAGGGAARLVRLAVKFYLSTTFVAALEGLLLFNIFSFGFTPLASAGGEVGASVTASPSASTAALDTVLKFAQDLVPDNIFRAFLEMKLLGVITFGMAFGAALSAAPGGRAVLQLLNTCFEALVGMIRAIIYFTPIGVASLVAGSVAKSDDLGAAMENMGKLFGVVLLGQSMHVFGFYAGAYLLLVRRNPFKYFSGMLDMWIVAFGTSSSAATLSTTCRTCEKLGVSKRTVAFVCPVGCTVNMDGSALERPIVVLWIAHMALQPLPLHRQLVLAVISSLMSIGGSPIPSAGVSTLLLMVEAAGVELTATVQLLAGFVLALEWLLDSIRTAVNVTGDAVGAAIIDTLAKDDASVAEAEVKADVENAAQVEGAADATE